MEGERKRVSVIVPTYHRDKSLVRTLRAVLRTLGDDDELIVVDQKPDHKLEVRAFLKKLASRPSVCVLNLDVGSLPLARNVGGLKATGDILLYLDDDLEFEPGLLECHLRYYDDPAVAGVAGHITKGGQLRFAPAEGFVRSATGCHMSFRKSAFLAIGGFNTNLIGNFACEEQEFCERIRRTVGKIASGNGCVVEHLHAREGGCGNRNRSDTWYRYTYHNVLYWAMNRPLPHLLLQLPRHLGFMAKYTCPSYRRLFSPGFMANTVCKAFSDALRTRFQGKSPPYWPDSSITIRQMTPD